MTQIQLFSPHQFGNVGFGSAFSACSHVLVCCPRGECADVMPLSVRACTIRSSFQALHWPLKHRYSKWISLRWKHYKIWRSKQALLISQVMHIYVSGFGIVAIECNVPIWAFVSSPLLNLNLIAGILVILAQKRISQETIKTLVERETSQG